MRGGEKLVLYICEKSDYYKHYPTGNLTWQQNSLLHHYLNKLIEILKTLINSVIF